MEEDEQTVGCGGFNLSKDGTAGCLSWDIFHPAYQGRGLGAFFCQYRIGLLRAMPGVSLIFVRTSQHTSGFYEKAGFVLVEVVKDYWAEGFDLYRMELAARA